MARAAAREGDVIAPAALFVNPGARAGADAFEAAARALGAAGVPLVAAERVDDPAALPGRVAAAVEAGAARVLVGGGDGTLSSAAGVLAGRDAALGVLPLGTGNDFARTLGIPHEVERAVEVFVRGVPRRVDLGRVDGHAFLNVASLGISSGLTKRLEDGLKKKVGRFAFLVSGAAEAANFQPFRARVVADGAAAEYDALQIVVGNGPFHGGGRLVAPGASNRDGTLHLYVLAAGAPGPELSPAERLRELTRVARYALLLGRGRHLTHPDVHVAAARAVRIETDPPLELDVDGELRGRTPVDLRVEPGALRVIARG
ncbi:MAG TPA: lipid kinase [Anaeromyxobacter sp.]|nr:lipid kinase [Anaeromyxobacter sp.]